MIRTSLAVALTLMLGSPAVAASTAAGPRLKELVAVSSEIVRIGDLVENAGAVSDVPVFRAPDLGQTGAVTVARVTDALRQYDMAGLDTGGLSEVVVTRLSRAISGKEITDRIAQAIAGQYGYGEAQNLSIVFDREVRALHVEPSVIGELAVARIKVEPRTGRFDIAFELPGSAAARRLPLRFTGTVTETMEAATLVRAIRPGEVVKASDVAMERKPRAEVGGDWLSLDQAIGLAAKNTLRAGQVLRPGDLMKPQIVQRHEAVTLTYAVPGILLTVRGKALEAGATGDVIGVLNIQSNRTIQGTVTGPGRVAILAAAMPTPAEPSASPDQQNEPTQ